MALNIAETKQYSNFGFTMAAMIALLFGLFFPLVFQKPLQYWPWIVAAVLVLWATVLPRTLKVIYHPWMYLGHIVGLINTKIILSIVFFIMITPISLILRILGKDYMNKKFNNKSSYWVSSQSKQRTDMDRCY